jgi:hypothetical protein
MDITTFLASWFGPYRFYNVDKKTARALLQFFNKAKLEDDKRGLLLVVLNKKGAATATFNESLLDINGLYSYIHKNQCFVSKDKRLVAERALVKSSEWRAICSNRNAWHGGVFGYPKCCIKRSLKTFKFFLKAGIFDRKLPPKTGFEKFLLHAKCSKNCKASKKLAKEYAEAIKEACPKLYVHTLGFRYCLEHLQEI